VPGRSLGPTKHGKTLVKSATDLPPRPRWPKRCSPLLSGELTASYARFCPNCSYRVFFCRAAQLGLAWSPKMRFHWPNQRQKHWFAMAINRLRHRAREVAIALAITLAAIAAVIATLSGQEEDAQTAQPMALVTPRK